MKLHLFVVFSYSNDLSIIKSEINSWKFEFKTIKAFFFLIYKNKVKADIDIKNLVVFGFEKKGRREIIELFVYSTLL